MNAMGPALTDEELADLLAPTGGSAPAPQADPEVAALRAALHTYRAGALQWAERRSSTQPSLQPAARRSRVWAAVPQWSLAAVAVISITAGVAHVYDRDDAADRAAAPAAVSAMQTAGVTASSQGTSPADIAADNALLSSIDQELSYHAALPVDSLGLESSRAGQTPAPGVTD